MAWEAMWKPSREYTASELEAAAANPADTDLTDELLMLIGLNVCTKCNRVFKAGQKLGQLPIVEGGPLRWHRKCPKLHDS